MRLGLLESVTQLNSHALWNTSRFYLPGNHNYFDDKAYLFDAITKTVRIY
ncbi:hypothetical protein VCSRO104_1456 [Vibrio cholerae]|nr:hypothetical protein VAB027_277 [Vibrio cholerae]GHW16814.1 hypothetical protein VCSRO54_3501 [Vibrio cholerae]GHW69134.1 hypothetical protein VCSRO198_1989 [Vibrio cholerae]GHW79266.1 hypothetical protein VCSRO104_1456 [Vibrio cholerae]GHX00929.1 hypothetical protein VCSRO105_3447 [Vibrio cholerae]